MFYIKRTFFFLILVLFYQNLSIANDKIAYIDLDYIINKSNAGNKLLKELENLNKSNLKKLSLIKKEIDKNKDEIIKVKNVISEKEFKNKIEEQKKSIREFDKTKKKLENEINELRRKKMIEIVKKINPVLEKYVEKIQ